MMLDLLLLAAMPLTSPAPASRAPVTLFECRIGAKTVQISAEGDRLSYSYGPPGKPELSLSGTARGGKIFYLAQRYAGMEYQLRFANGDTSYVVFSFEGNGNVGAEPASGLVVFRGGKRIADHSCASHAEFSADFDYSIISEDSDKFSAM